MKVSFLMLLFFINISFAQSEIVGSNNNSVSKFDLPIIIEPFPTVANLNKIEELIFNNFTGNQI